MKKTLLLITLVFVTICMNASTVTNYDVIGGGYSYNFTGTATLNFTNYGHLSITGTLENLDVSQYKSITINYTGKTGTFKMAAIGKVEEDSNKSFQEITLPEDAAGSATITFDASEYTSNKAYEGETSKIYRVDLYNNSSGTDNITITSVVLTDNTDATTNMEYTNKWNVTANMGTTLNFAGWAIAGKGTWVKEVTANTVQKITINFASAIPAGFQVVVTVGGNDYNYPIPANATSYSIYRDAAYSEISLKNNTGISKSVTISSVTCTELSISSTSSSLLTDHNLGGSYSHYTTLSADSYSSVNTTLQNAKVNQLMKITCTGANSDSRALQISGRSYNKLSDEFLLPTLKDVASQVFLLPLNKNVIEVINQGGIIISGQNITVNSLQIVTTEESAAEVLSGAPITITSAGIATYSNPRKLNFTGTSITAYIATSENAETKKITMTRINKVPENTPLYLVAEPGSYDIPYYTGDDTETATPNLLVATQIFGAKVYESLTGEYRYILASKAGEAGFYKATDSMGSTESGGTYDGKKYHTLAPYKAYLQTTNDLSPDPGARIALVFDDDMTTGINTLNVEHKTLNGEVYDLSGRRVAKPTKGLYIVNGKKVVIK